MKSASVRLLATALFASLIAGCSTTPPGQPGNYFGNNNVTGNWAFQNTSAPLFYGSLSGSGSSIAGTLYNNVPGCVPATQPIAFAGTEDTLGRLTLTSTNLPNNVATITATVTTIGGITSGPGSIAITGSGSCAIGAINITATELENVTGNYAGTLNPTAGSGAATVAAQLLGASPSPSFSGTVTVTIGSCSDTFAISQFATLNGPNLFANLTSTSGPAGTAVLSAAITNVSPLTLATTLTITGGCNAGTYNGTLTAH